MSIPSLVSFAPSRSRGLFLSALGWALGGALLLLPPPAKAGQLDGFARCLAGKSATFYGAYWCPVCKTQKKLFEDSAQYLDYVECAQRGTREKRPICVEKGITKYATWIFADGSRVSGSYPLEFLSQKTGCSLPW